MANDILSNSGNINWFAPTWDLLIFVFFVVVAFMYGLSLGKERMSVALLCIYVSLALVSNISYLSVITEKLGFGYPYLVKMMLFWMIVILLFVVFLKSLLAEYMSSFAGGWKSKRALSQTIVFSILNIGLLTSISLSFLPEELVAKSLPVAKMVFYNEPSRLIWLIIPLGALILIQREVLREIEKEQQIPPNRI